MIRRSLAIAALTAALPTLAAAQRATAPTKSRQQIAQECGLNKPSKWMNRLTGWFFEPKPVWSNDTLRKELMHAAGLAPELVLPPVLGYEFVLEDAPGGGTSSDPMIRRLLKLAAERGSTWPTKSVVGAGGVHAVFVLAHRDTALLRAALHRMMEAGPTESPAAEVAMLEDRLRLTSGRKQIFGTQFMVNTKGAPVLAPMEDAAHADMRREDAGLPPLATALCLARAAVPRAPK